MQKLTIDFLRTCVPALLFLCSFGVSAQQFSALLVIQAATFQHESTFVGIPALRQLAERHDFVLDVKQRSRPLNDTVLEKYDVVIFLNTTGDIFKDHEQAAFERYLQSGKGWVGIHAASDTEYGWPWYVEMVGHMFKIHPKVQTAMLDVHDNDFPGLTSWPKRLMWTDEYYEYLDGTPKEGCNYLLTVDESTYDISAQWGEKKAVGHGDFHPISWYRHYDGGRAWYTNLGHVPGVFTDDHFLTHLYGGIYWAATGKGK